VVSRVPSQEPAAGIQLPRSSSLSSGTATSQLGGRFNPAQINGLSGPISLGFGESVHGKEHNDGSGIGRDSASSRQ